MRVMQAWATSSYCNGNGCVETYADTVGVRVRDSKPGAGDQSLRFDRRAWSAFIAAIR